MKSMSMQYTDYEAKIKTAYHVELIGWPSSVKFCAPCYITTVNEVRILLEALKNGNCRWHKMSQNQVDKQAEKEIVVKTRAPRKDKGVKRGPRKRPNPVDAENGGNDENDAVQPARKVSRGNNVGSQLERSRGPTSNEFVGDSDEDID
jgi:hypothetical protein